MSGVQITLELTQAQRSRYAQLADVLVPAAHGMPSASEADVHTRWIDEALRLRPDLRPLLDRALQPDNEGMAPLDALLEMARTRADAFTALGALTVGAYYMDDRVRQAMGYPGQEDRPLVDDSGEYLDMLERVAERGPIYRATPA